MTASVPARVRWAVETLAVKPSDQLLEIGCGPGVAAALICAQLVDGGMLAIDQSAIQIERARTRNEAHVAGGWLELETVALADLDVGAQRFDKIFAINVNVFWRGPAEHELARVRGALVPDGALFLFYETPSAARAREAAERVAAALRMAGFGEPDFLSPAPTRACVISQQR